MARTTRLYGKSKRSYTRLRYLTPCSASERDFISDWILFSLDTGWLRGSRRWCRCGRRRNILIDIAHISSARLFIRVSYHCSLFYRTFGLPIPLYKSYLHNIQEASTIPYRSFQCCFFSHSRVLDLVTIVLDTNLTGHHIHSEY